MGASLAHAQRMLHKIEEIDQFSIMNILEIQGWLPFKVALNSESFLQYPIDCKNITFRFSNLFVCTQGFRFRESTALSGRARRLKQNTQLTTED